VKVKTARLLDYLNQPVDMLKMVIEGAEFEVLQDCSGALINVEKIFLEYHGLASESQTLQIILETLYESGFRYHIREAFPINHPLIRKERQRKYDLQLNIFGFRD
jgi:hypothetical protein